MRVLLLLPAASYRNEDFLASARRLGVEVITVADYCPRLAPRFGLPPLAAVPFHAPERAVEEVLAHLPARPDAVLAVDDHGVELAALLAARVGLPGNPPHAVRRLRDKLAFRHFLRQSGLPCPEFWCLGDEEDATALAERLPYPVVVKPRGLSASQGVIRADDAASFDAAVARARAIARRAASGAVRGLLVERFIPGREYALEGVLCDGRLEVLALFDKPDPLDGPYFEETLYVTPSRALPAVQAAIAAQVERAARAAGMNTGPIHAEMRVKDAGPGGVGVWLLEIAPRTIGGLCGRVLRHALGMSLEELVLRHALGLPLPVAREAREAAVRAGSRGPAGGGDAPVCESPPAADSTRAELAAGVMMIPIPKRGIYAGVRGVEAARAVPGITGVEIAVEPGMRIVPLPEGSAYLGFIFARVPYPVAATAAPADSTRAELAAAAVEAAVRAGSRGPAGGGDAPVCESPPAADSTRAELAAAAVEAALRTAHARLVFDIRTEVPAVVHIP